jgi:hypothetical protein
MQAVTAAKADASKTNAGKTDATESDAGRSAHDELFALNRDYIRSVETSDVTRFDQILADDFLCSNPDGTLINRETFLERVRQPSSVTNIETSDVNVRLMGNFAIIHARTNFTLRDGKPGTGRKSTAGQHLHEPVPEALATPTSGPAATGNGLPCRRM